MKAHADIKTKKTSRRSLLISHRTYSRRRKWMGVQCRVKHPQNGSGGLLRFTLDLSTDNKFTIVISNNGARNGQVEVGTNSMWNFRASVRFVNASFPSSYSDNSSLLHPVCNFSSPFFYARNS